MGLAQMSPVHRPHPGDSPGDKSSPGSIQKNTVFCPPAPRRVPYHNLHPSPVITPHLASGDPEAQGGDVTGPRCHGQPRASCEPPAFRGRTDSTQHLESGGPFASLLPSLCRRPARCALRWATLSFPSSLVCQAQAPFNLLKCGPWG